MEKTINKQIGERIKKRRNELKLTQEEFAKRLNINNRSAITRYEKGEKTFKQSQIVALAEALETTPSYLMGWDEEKEDNTNNAYSKIGNNLKSIRESRNISTEEIAMEFNISVEDVLNYENGLKEIPIEYLKMFATYFNVTVDELIYFDVDNHRTIFITKDEELSKRYKKWQELIGYDIKFTDEEIDEIINFAKYVISKRKE